MKKDNKFKTDKDKSEDIEKLAKLRGCTVAAMLAVTTTAAVAQNSNTATKDANVVEKTITLERGPGDGIIKGPGDGITRDPDGSKYTEEEYNIFISTQGEIAEKNKIKAADVDRSKVQDFVKDAQDMDFEEIKNNADNQYFEVCESFINGYEEHVAAKDENSRESNIYEVAALTEAAFKMQTLEVVREKTIPEMERAHGAAVNIVNSIDEAEEIIDNHGVASKEYKEVKSNASNNFGKIKKAMANSINSLTENKNNAFEDTKEFIDELDNDSKGKKVDKFLEKNYEKAKKVIEKRDKDLIREEKKELKNDKDFYYWKGGNDHAR